MPAARAMPTAARTSGSSWPSTAIVPSKSSARTAQRIVLLFSQKRLFPHAGGAIITGSSSSTWGRRREPAMNRFANRSDGGRRLGEALAVYSGQPDVVVLGLPRGGIPVGAEVARRLHATFDAFLVRKLGVPGHEE